MKYKISEAFIKLQKSLQDISESPTLEAEIILQKVLKLSREELVLKNNIFISKKNLIQIEKIVNLRKSPTPLEHILCTKDFYRHEFYVNKNTLIPRPETEILVDKCVEKIINCSDNEINILEVGIGSGCIFISVASELLRLDAKKSYTFYLTDISSKAILVAKKNLQAIIPKEQNSCKFIFYKADILPKSLAQKPFNFIISNPPYIPEADLQNLQKEVKCEPLIALSGGNDGLEIYRKILLKTKNCLTRKAIILFEIYPSKADELIKLFNTIYHQTLSIELIKDLNGLQRVMLIYQNIQ
ncbi:peptide chain release factor N(5)-glutamine methyltransferase [Candidatus Dojkabacteria bacterium]|nr:peptide chain release factor N(5)-glutamine methyltransferase [Candidatus Dojkabacteria bacterium]